VKNLVQAAKGFKNHYGKKKIKENSGIILLLSEMKLKKDEKYLP